MNHEQSIRETKRQLTEKAIREGGFYGRNGVWNSIITFSGDKHIYRHRVETLIVKDGKEVFVKKKPSGEYFLPGGSTELKIPNMDQAVNECREEAHINVRNIESTGITYKEERETPSCVKKEWDVEWDGVYTEIYAAEYDSMFKGHIDKEDEDPFIRSGQFYSTKECFKFFKQKHREALLWYIKSLNEHEEEVTESYVSNYFHNKKFLKKIAGRPEIERSVVEQIITILKKNYGELSAKSKIQRERQKDDVDTIFHPILDFDFPDGNTITLAICFDDKSFTDGAALHTDAYGDIVIVYPKFFKERKDEQMFTLLHEIGHVRLHHLEYKYSHKNIFGKDNTNDYRIKKMDRGSVMYPEVNADLYAVLNGANMYTILSNTVKKDYDADYDYRFTNQELANRYDQVFKKYSYLNPVIEGDQNMENTFSSYDIACLAVYEMVYENQNTAYLTESEKNELYSIVYEFTINKTVKNDPAVMKAEERLKKAKLALKAAKGDVKKERHLNSANPAFLSDEEKEFKKKVRDSMEGHGIEAYTDRALYAAKNELKLAEENLTKVKTAAYAALKKSSHGEVKQQPQGQNPIAAKVATEKSYCVDEFTAVVESMIDKLTSSNTVTESGENKSAHYVYLMESLTTKERNAISLNEFGIPEERKFPLDTEKHVRSAIRLFGTSEEKYRSDLAKKIFKAMSKYEIPMNYIGPKNKLNNYK